MADPRPLWEVMAEACAEHPDGIVDLKPGAIAAMIRALRDQVAPIERTLDPIWHGTIVESEYDWRQRLRALLTAEADRTERGESEPECKVQRVYINNPVQIAECGGPCMEGGPEACDCGALWRDQPEPEGPTDEELYELWEADGEGDFQECRRFARAVLARWGASSRSN